MIKLHAKRTKGASQSTEEQVGVTVRHTSPQCPLHRPGTAPEMLSPLPEAATPAPGSLPRGSPGANNSPPRQPQLPPPGPAGFNSAKPRGVGRPGRKGREIRGFHTQQTPTLPELSLPFLTNHSFPSVGRGDPSGQRQLASPRPTPRGEGSGWAAPSAPGRETPGKV